MSDEHKQTLDLARDLKAEILKLYEPPEDGIPSAGQLVIPNAVVRRTRGYIEKVANEVNGCYENGWYDACAVMMRRLIETLIIEAFEKHNIASKIKNQDNDFLALEDLISRALNEPSWNIGRNAKSALPRLKKLGDLSAHSRRYNAFLKDIQPLTNDFRLVVQEFIYIAGLK